MDKWLEINQVALFIHLRVCASAYDILKSYYKCSNITFNCYYYYHVRGGFLVVIAIHQHTCPQWQFSYQLHTAVMENSVHRVREHAENSQEQQLHSTNFFLF